MESILTLVLIMNMFILVAAIIFQLPMIIKGVIIGTVTIITIGIFVWRNKISKKSY